MNGIYQTIWLDNYFPVYNQMIARMIKPNGEKAGDPNAPIFAEAYGNELWVALAEKAWAKAHGGYLITAGGMCGETLRDLTGAPSYSHRF